jgi:Ca-activated chloride channel family protein
MTRLNAEVLDRVARETGGSYTHAGLDLDLSRVATEIAQMEKKDLGSNRMSVYEERYQYFLLVALLLLIAEFMVSERVRRRHEWKGRFA